MANKPLKIGHSPDYFLLAAVFLLTITGIVMLVSASSELGKIKFDDSYYYFKHQVENGLIFGVLGFAAAYFVNYQRYRSFALIFLAVNIILLALVFTGLGIKSGGANRWLRLGPVTFQPAELLKLTFIMYLAAWFSKGGSGRDSKRGGGLIVFIVAAGIVGALLALQPTTSTAFILLASGLAIYFLSGAPVRHVAGLITIGAVSFAVLIYITPYRLDRIRTFLDPQRDAAGLSYHVNEAVTTIKSGGATGIGFGQSKEKIGNLPAPIDDSIFAIIAQELGFAGAGILIALFAAFSIRAFWIARRVRDRFGQLLLVGFGTVIALQSIVNIGAISGLFPLTGVPLPFISYGGTALFTFLTMSGVMVNISKYA